MKYTENENMVQIIRECGQSLIDNAESIVDYKHIKDLTITCFIRTKDPSIDVDISFYPENFIERIRK